jgi:hypothetical protein
MTDATELLFPSLLAMDVYHCDVPGGARVETLQTMLAASNEERGAA